MKILVVCQYYYPENFQITPICEELVQRGHEVTVLTGLPNYPTGVIPEEYKKGHRDEFVKGVHVLRCREHGRKSGVFHLALNYVSFYLSANRAIRKIKEQFDLVFVYQLSPVFMGIPALRYAKKSKKPLLVYCCDLWPESLKVYIHNEKNPVFRYCKRISQQFYNSADSIIAQSQSFIPYLVDTHGISENKICYIPAFSDDDYLSENFNTSNEIVNFMFLGNLGVAQDLINVLRAVELIKDQASFKIHFVGDGSTKNQMEEYVVEHHLETHVVFHGRRPVDEMPSFYKIADVCLVSLKADSAIGLTLPTKMQGYMAAGKPILGMINGSAKEVIDEAKCGICVCAGDYEGLASAMKELLSNKERLGVYGNNSREYFASHFKKNAVMDMIESKILALCLEKELN